MNKLFLLCAFVAVVPPLVASPNYHDPKNIMAGSPYWFFRVDGGRWELALPYPRMQQDILRRMEREIADYRYPGHAQEAEARAFLEKAYRDLRAAYAKAAPHQLVPCTDLLTHEELRELVQQTPRELFPIEFLPTRPFMVGPAGPHREDFERRIQLEKAYDAWLQRLACSRRAKMKRRSKKLLRQFEQHLERAYRTIIEQEGLSI